MAAPMPIGELLKSKGLINDKQLGIAIVKQQVTGQILGELLVGLGFVSAKECSLAIAEQFGIEFVDLDSWSIGDDALRLVPKEVAKQAGFLPLDLTDGVLSIGITNPSNITAVDAVVRLTSRPPKIYMVDAASFQDHFEKAYYFVKDPVPQRIAETIAAVAAMTGTIPGQIFSDLTDLIIMEGIRLKATDIHITPTTAGINVFNRIDGVLQYGHYIPKSVHSGIVSRIKILSQLDIAEQRLPQDGSFSFEFLGRQYEIRVATITTINGENLVLRVLYGTDALRKLGTLGMYPEQIQSVKRLLAKTYGIVLVTGPTGSGKTTTLFAALRELNVLERNVITVEDPVEYRLSFVRQTQVNEKTGFTFALASRNFMRQDPDVMLLGEIRDKETANIAFRASITGHLVFSTLHTSDAVTAIPRLLDLGVDAYPISSSLLAVLAQRLVRRVCLHCREEYLPDEEELAIFRAAGHDTLTTAVRGRGCAKCHQTGYSGRLLVCELLVVTDRIREMIFSGASSIALYEAAVGDGMIPLKADGIRKAAEGMTTLREVLRVAG
jgi:type II secretory ATPase GspE/PulE/Tfp pilus assembly ATPase PilB-like protein